MKIVSTFIGIFHFSSHQNAKPSEKLERSHWEDKCIPNPLRKDKHHPSSDQSHHSEKNILDVCLVEKNCSSCCLI